MVPNPRTSFWSLASAGAAGSGAVSRGTAVLPPAGQLVARMSASIRAANSYRVVSQAKQFEDHDWYQILRVSTDVDLRANGFREDVTEVVRKLRPSRLSSPPNLPKYRVDRYSAVATIRAGRLTVAGGRTLQCAGPDLDWVQLRIYAGSGLLVGAHSSTLGLARVRGITSWHVRTTATALRGVPRQQQILIDDYIAPADYRLVEEQMTAIIRFGSVRIDYGAVNDFSRYGEQVHVRTPNSCRVSR